MHVEPWLERAAALQPGRVAVETPQESVTYAELLARARRFAGALTRQGVRAGDRVAVLAQPDVAFVAALHACLLSGAVAVPVDPRLTAEERGRRVAGAGRPPAHSSLSADARPQGYAAPRAADPALVVHTSGTSGAPRAVTLSHGNLLASALGAAAAVGLDPRERWLCPLPLAHVGGLMVLVRSAIYATTAVLLPPPFHGEAASRALGEATIASMVSTMLRRLLDTGAPAPAALRVILLGGAPADRPLLRRARDAGYPVAQTYGLTEACSQVTVSAPGDLDSAGRALPGVGLTISEDREIVVEGPTVAGGGVLRTGDLGFLDGAGRLVVTGRRDELIVSGGENVAPAEVESVLLEHSAVADAAVFGVPDPEWGRAVSARVVLRSGRPADEQQLRRHCAERLAAFKVPKAVRFVDSLPRTASGKLLRRHLG